jgi:predicted transcriptional regulator
VTKRAGDYLLTLDVVRVDPEVATILERAADKGLSMRKLAEKAGVSLSTIFHIKSGNRAPRMSTLRRMQEAVGIR